jgi:hypothetical protein
MIIIGFIIFISNVKIKYLGILITILFTVLIFMHIKDIFKIIMYVKDGEKFSKKFGLLFGLAGIFLLVVNIEKT